MDEALLVQVGRSESPPTLRFYGWDPPTVSLGYFQRYADFRALPPPAGKLAVVRRTTGGGAILHDLELTYSLTLPLSHPLVRRGGPGGLYAVAHSAVEAVLSRLGLPITRGPAGGGCSHRGPFFCFERHACFDLLVEGRKLMGSAQRRTREAVLQHGSLILDSRFPQQRCATVSAYAQWDVNQALPELAALIASEGAGPASELDRAELQLARELHGKYAGQEWTRQR